MRIFVAGATGVIGRQVVPLLLAQGHHVTGLTRSAASAARITSLGAEAVSGDALDADAVLAAVRAARPDVIMHQLTDLGSRDFAANSALRVSASRNLADAGVAVGVRRFVSQSIAWAYAPGAVPADESVSLDPTVEEPRRTTVHGVASLESATARFPEWVVLRYGVLYGPGTWYWSDGAMAAAALAGSLVAGGDVTSFVHVSDAAAAAAQALEWPSGAVNICDDEPAAGVEWVPVFCRSVGADVPVASDGRVGFARGADNSYARGVLGWQPRWVSWREGFGGSAGAVG